MFLQPAAFVYSKSCDFFQEFLSEKTNVNGILEELRYKFFCQKKKQMTMEFFKNCGRFFFQEFLSEKNLMALEFFKNCCRNSSYTSHQGFFRQKFLKKNSAAILQEFHYHLGIHV